MQVHHACLAVARFEGHGLVAEGNSGGFDGDTAEGGEQEVARQFGDAGVLDGVEQGGEPVEILRVPPLLDVVEWRMPEIAVCASEANAAGEVTGLLKLGGGVGGKLGVGQPDEERVDVHGIRANAVLGTGQGRGACATERVQHAVALAQRSDQFLDQMPRVCWREAQPPVASEAEIGLEGQRFAATRWREGGRVVGEKESLGASLH